MLRAAAACVLVLVAAANAPAQVVRGTVRDAESGAALQGVFVMLVDSATQMRGGVLTDENGFFAMRAPRPGSYTLRADRIGHHSTTSGGVLLTAAEPRTVDINVRIAAIQLAPVEVATRNRCVSRPRSGQRTAQLWEEVRKALTVARWVTSERRVQFSTRSYVRELDAHTMQVKSEGVRHEVSRNLPYAAIDADTLAKYGFVRNEGAGFVFYGPDADVLLSEVFLDGHCFHSVDGSGDTRGMIGLGFRPTAGSKLPDIEGVLWLDRNTLELHHIDYRYLNLGREYRARDTGGRTEFMRLKSGAWIVSRWHIRMPTVVASGMDRGEYRLVALQEEGGEVLNIRDSESEQAIARDGVIRGLVYDSARGAPLANATVYLSGTSYLAQTDTAGRFEIRSVPDGRYTISFTHPVLDSLPALPDPRAVHVRTSDTTATELSIRPVGEQITRRCGPAYRGAVHDAAGAVLFGVVRNVRGAAQANATVTIGDKGYRTGANGEYAICGLRLNVPLTVRVLMQGDVVARSKLTISGQPYRRFDFQLEDP